MLDIEESILQNLPLLVNKISNLDEILRLLLSKKILSLEEFQRLECIPTEITRIEKLCLLIRKKSREHQDEFLEILESTGNTEAVSMLTDGIDLYSNIRQAKKQIWFEVAEPSPKFYGRKDELEKINESFQSSTTTSGKNKRGKLVVVSGLGGLGKTQIARKLAKKYYEEEKASVIWIRAQTSATMITSFMNLADTHLKMKTKKNGMPLPIEVLVKNIYLYFSTGNSLFIFDNCETFKETTTAEKAVNDFLPSEFNFSPDFNKPCVLITTRISKLIPDAHEIPLGCFTLEDSHTFVRHNLPDDLETEGNDLADLCNLLQCFPLALQQAISYISQQYEVKQNYTLKNYMDSYNLKAKNLLAHQGQYSSEHEYQFTTLITWNITLDKIRQNRRDGHLASSILNVIAYLSPDQIERHLLCQLLDVEPESDDLDGAIKLPAQYSMYNLDKGVISVHRLVQQVIQIELQGQNGAENTLLTDILVKFYQILLDTESRSTSAVSPITLGHICSAWNHSQKDEYLIEKFQKLPFKITMQYRQNSMFSEALAFALKSLPLLEKQRGTTEIGILTIFSLKQLIGDTHCELGNYAEAEKALTNVLSEARERLPNEKAFIIVIMHNLARVYETGRLDKPEKAKELTQGIIHITTIMENASKNAGDINFTKTYNNQAGELVSEKKFWEALKIYEKIYADQIAVFDLHHPDVTLTRNNIAEVLRLLGKFKEAEKLHAENELCQTNLSEDHLHRITTENNTALNYLQLGNADKALEIFERSYRLQKEKMGQMHPETIKTYQNMAECYRNKQNFQEALRIHEEAVASLLKQFPLNHSLVIHAKNYIGVVYLKSGQYKSAMSIFEENFALECKESGKSHPNTCKTRNNMAEVFREMGNYEQAYILHEENYSLQNSALGANHPEVIISRNNLAKSSKEVGRFDKAIQLYKINLECEIESLGEEHLDVCKTRHNLSFVYLKLEKWAEAFAIQKQNYETRRKLLGERDPLTVESKENMNYINTKRSTYSTEDLEYKYQVCKFTLGEDHPQTKALKEKLDEMKK